MAQVGADLMSATRLRPGFEQAVAFIMLQYTKVGDRRFSSGGINDGAMATVAIGAERIGKRAFIPGRIPLDECMVNLFYLVFLELDVQIAMRLC
jgi:hypothetical protein